MNQFGYATTKVPQLVARAFNFNLTDPDSIDRFNDGVDVLVKLYESGVSPGEIKKQYGISYSDFGTWLKRAGANRRNLSDARQAFAGTLNNPQYKVDYDSYRRACSFKNFTTYDFLQIPGKEIMSEGRGVYHPVRNIDGWVKDHMFSVSDGWHHPSGVVDPDILSHPANCEFMYARLNESKGRKSSITLDQLKLRISNWWSGGPEIIWS